MEIRLYARGPSQEYSAEAGKPGQHAYKWSSRAMVPGEPTAQRNGACLGDYLRLRRESAHFGFVHNLDNDLIFITDAEAFTTIEQRLEEPLSILMKTDLPLLEALHFGGI